MTDVKPLVQSSSGMIHVEGCPHIAHYVDGHRERVTFDQGVAHEITRVDPQTELVRTITSESVERRWVSARIDRDNLAAVGHYTRCSHCAPDVPEYVTPTRYVSKEARALGHKDVGRESTDGRIDEVRHSAQSVVVRFSEGRERSYAPSERLEFAVVPRRA
ncbi:MULTISPECIES: hypothetical protein [unclassified Microbacterium]|uniref:hypothetical protein n=1 Tax=unclassified Microbacterium TaxID=2609290 RepID=UPI00301034F5